MNGAAFAFDLEIERAFNAYLDSIYGYNLQLKEVEENQQKKLDEFRDVSPEKANLTYLDSRELSYYIGLEKINRGTMWDSKSRNSRNGSNTIWVGKMFLVTIYELWDSCYRAKIAEKYDISSGDLKCNSIGDLRIIRQWIVHSSPVDTGRLIKVDWFDENESNFFKPENIYKFVAMIRSDLEKFY